MCFLGWHVEVDRDYFLGGIKLDHVAVEKRLGDFDKS